MISRINEKENANLILKNFIESAGESLETFRYFEKRSFNTIRNHFHTVILSNAQGESIGYGHLDQCDAGKIWLGICLRHGYTGKGLGKSIMKNLLNYADKNDIKEINLSVDISNPRGKNLYEQFGFEVYNKTETMYFMNRRKYV